MEQGYELRLADIRKAVLEESHNNELYIPLHGKHTTNPEEESFDLAQKIHSFFEFNDATTSDPKVMLLMGDTGSGKSVFSQQIYQQLWKNYQAGNPISLWIPLPELDNPFESAVEEVLKKYGLDDSQISEVKAKEKFIFVVDGYDELHQFQNCYVTNGWDKWNAKVLMTCRSQALYYQKDPDKYFMPFNGEKRLPQLLRRLYVAAFSKEQISSYVKKYQALNSGNKISDEDFARVPGLTELITTPFLLHLSVETLPDILASQIDDQKMTQAKLYDVFIEQWFTRQINKLSEARLLTDTEKNTKQQFWGYCKKLAQQMHEKKVTMIPYQGQKTGGRLFGKQEQTNVWEPFFNEEAEVLRSACPLRRYGEHYYGYIHASMVEYFATRAMYEEIEENKIEALVFTDKGKEEDMVEHITHSVIEKNQLRGGIHQRVFALELKAIQFIADRIEMSEAFRQKMLAILDASKKSKLYAIGAANAITALVRAGVAFNGANLSGINISGADISGGFFDRADISNADLSNVQMFHVWLREACFNGCRLDGINFGEYPWFNDSKRFLYSFDYREDLQSLIKGCNGHNKKNSEIVCEDIVTGEQLYCLKGHKDNISSVQFSPDGKYIVSGSWDKTVRIWNVESKKTIAVLKCQGEEVTCVQFSPDGKWVVSGSNTFLRIWDVANGNEFAVMRGHNSSIKSVAFSPNGELVVSGSSDKTVRIWEIVSAKEITVLKGHAKGVNCVAFSPHGKWIVSGSDDGTVRVWDVLSNDVIVDLEHKNRVSNTREGQFSQSKSRVNSVAFSPNGEWVVSGSIDKSIRVWDVRSGQQLAVLNGHQHFIYKVQFNQDGERLVSCSWDKTVRVWDIASGRLPVNTRWFKTPVLSVQHSPDGKWVILACGDDTFRVWGVNDGKEIAVLQGHESYVKCVRFSQDGKYVIAGGLDVYCRVWEVSSWQLVFKEFIGGTVNSVALSPNGRFLVCGMISPDTFYNDNKPSAVRIWDLQDHGRYPVRLVGHKKGVNCVEFSPDGERIATASEDMTIWIWEVPSWKKLRELRGHTGEVGCVVFSPDGSRVISGSQDMTVRIWNVVSGKAMVVFKGHEDEVQRVQFNSHGNRAISGSKDLSLRVWDIDSATCLKVLKLHAAVMDFSYHPNGSLVVGFDDESIEVWNNIGDEQDYCWQLQWSTNYYSSNLCVEGLNAKQINGLSDQNCRLLKQRGAIITGHTELNVLEESLNSRVAKRSGSPIHNNVSGNNTPIEDNEDEDEEEKARRCVIA